MAYFPDLSPYTFFKPKPAPKLQQKSLFGWPRKPNPNNAITLNIGWLEEKNPFETGTLSEAFLDRLFLLCGNPPPEFRTRGLHTCDFCPEKAMGARDIRNGAELVAGSAEIRISGLGDIIYAAPNMIYHYVAIHYYLPPSIFVQAVHSLTNAALHEILTRAKLNYGKS